MTRRSNKRKQLREAADKQARAKDIIRVTHPFHKDDIDEYQSCRVLVNICKKFSYMYNTPVVITG